MSKVESSIGSRLKGPNPCDTCRLRKVRCDKQSPCSNCKTAHIPCVYTDTPPPKRQKISLSNEYNSDISDIKHGIDKIWNHLSSQNVKSPSAMTQCSAGSTAHISVETISSSNQDQWPPFEGASSFHAASQRVMDEIQKDTFPSRQLTVPSLSGEPAADHLAIRAPQGISQAPLIPIATVLRILKAAKGVFQSKLGLVTSLTPSDEPGLFDDFPFVDLNDLSLICQRVYFPVEGLSITDLITVHTCVFFITRDLVQRLESQFGFDPLEIQQILSRCSTTLTQVTRELPLLIQPSFENVRALLLLASVLLEVDQFATASSVTSIVSRLCLDAGYHRLQSGDAAAKSQQKRLVFWKTFVLDRGFALSLGKAPSIPEYEVCLDRPSPGEVPGLTGVYLNGWIDFAEIQGRVYEQLYSPQAQKADTATKAVHAQHLAERLTLLWTSMPSDQAGLNVEMRWHSEIAINTMLTLIYHAIELDSRHDQSSHISTSKSLLYARIGLDKLNEAWEALGDGEQNRQSASFLVWSVQFSPFAPFIVVLRNAFYHNDEMDVKRLRKAVAAIETTSKISNGIARLYSICEKLLSLLEDRLSDVRQSEAEVDDSDRHPFVSGNYDFVAVMEDTENLPLFMDSWEAFLNSQK